MPTLKMIFFGALLFAAPLAQAREGSGELSDSVDRVQPLPLPEPTGDSLALQPKKSLLRRIVDYFSEANRDKTFEKKIDFTFIGGPSYSKETQFSLAVMASGLYRIDRTDSQTQPSDITAFVTGSTTGFYKIGLDGNTLLRQNRHRIIYALSFYSQPTDYWGIGYRAGSENARSSFLDTRYEVSGKYLRQMVGNLFAGVELEFHHIRGRDFGRPEYIEGQNPVTTATGIGALLEYDSRDVITNAYQGIYVGVKASWRPRFLSSLDHTLWRVNVTLNGYRRLWKGSVLACELYGDFNSPHTPWSLKAKLGGSQRMRGYYEGRYNDNDLLAVQVELRQRIWRRIGCVVWGGAGNVFHSLDRFRWDRTLPNYGVGLRWEFKKRVNIRVDYGFGKKTSGILFNLNEAF